MSGIEIAGLAFGVLPVLIEAIKSYQSICERLHTLRHYLKAAKRMYLRFSILKTRFRNECLHLLRPILNENEDLLDVVQNVSPERNETIQRQLNELLGDDGKLCKAALEEIKSVIEEVASELSHVDALIAKTPDVSRPCRALGLLHHSCLLANRIGGAKGYDI